MRRSASDPALNLLHQFPARKFRTRAPMLLALPGLAEASAGDLVPQSAVSPRGGHAVAVVCRRTEAPQRRVTAVSRFVEFADDRITDPIPILPSSTARPSLCQ